MGCVPFPEEVLEESLLCGGRHVARTLSEEVHCPEEMNLCSCWFTGRCGGKVVNEGCFCCRELVAGIGGHLLKHLEGVVQTLPWYLVLLVLPGVVSRGLAIRVRHVGEPATRQLLLGVDGLPRQKVMERRTRSLRGVWLVRLWVAVGVPTVAGLVRQVWMEGLTC